MSANLVEVHIHCFWWTTAISMPHIAHDHHSLGNQDMCEVTFPSNDGFVCTQMCPKNMAEGCMGSL